MQVFTKLCSAAVAASGASTLMAPLESLVSGSAAALWQAAAYLAHAVTQVGPHSVAQCVKLHACMGTLTHATADGRCHQDLPGLALALRSISLPCLAMFPCSHVPNLPSIRCCKLVQDVPGDWLPYLNCMHAPRMVPALCSMLVRGPHSWLCHGHSIIGHVAVCSS